MWKKYLNDLKAARSKTTVNFCLLLIVVDSFMCLFLTISGNQPFLNYSPDANGSFQLTLPIMQHVARKVP